MYFEYPALLWLLVLPLLLIVHYVYMEIKGRNPHLRVSNAIPWKQEKNTVLNIIRHMPFVLRIVALSLIITAIARPRSSTVIVILGNGGIDRYSTN